jgi:hypothetical protein
MAMGLPYGLQAMLKEGHKHFSGVEEAVMKNIDACKALSQITRTSLGPNGMINNFRIRHGSSAAVYLQLTRRPVATLQQCAQGGTCATCSSIQCTPVSCIVEKGDKQRLMLMCVLCRHEQDGDQSP